MIPSENEITFKQAKVLKEKGFPQNLWPCGFFSNGDYETICCNPRIMKGEEWCSGCLLPLVQKWLREEKNIYLSVDYDKEHDIWKCILYNKDTDYTTHDYEFIYEKVLSKGIDEALELI